MNYLLIAILTLLIWSVFDGYKKGFMRTVFALVSWIIVLVVCNIATPMVTDFLIEETSIADTVGDAIAEKVNEVIAQSGVAELEQNLPEEIKNMLAEGNINIEELLAANGDVIVDATSIVYTVVSIIAFVLVIVVTRVLVWVVDKVLGIASKFPLIGSLDKLLGLVCGAAKGILICWIVLAVVSMVVIPNANVDFASMIQESQLLTWLQNNNYILKMFVGKAIVL